VVKEPEELVFLESGTWHKPPGAVSVLIELRGGDGSGGAGSSTGAAFRAAGLPDEMEVHVGGGVASLDRASGAGWARVTTYFDDRQPTIIGGGRRP
jgi:hypothetical protein